MEEAGVAGPELSHEIVHSQLERLRILLRDDLLPRCTGQIWPIGPFEVRVEVLLGDLVEGLIENLGALGGGQLYSGLRISLRHIQSLQNQPTDSALPFLHNL